MHGRKLLANSSARPCRQSDKLSGERGRFSTYPGSKPKNQSILCRRSFRQGRLRRREPGDRHPIGRAGHIVEPHLLAEADRGGIAAMLAANAELDRRPRLRARARRRSAPVRPPLRCRATRRDRSSRIPLAVYSPRKRAESSRLMPKVVWVRSLVPKEKNSAVSAMSPARKAARGSSIMVPTR